MGNLTDAQVFLLLAGSGLLLLQPIGALLLQMGCALADITVPTFARSVKLFALTGDVCVVLLVVSLAVAGFRLDDPSTLWGPGCLWLVIAGGLLTLTIAPLIYVLIVRAPILRGALAAGVQLVLVTLLTAIITFIVFIILAVVQVTQSKPGHATADAPAMRNVG
jgi:hypothetical protein